VADRIPDRHTESFTSYRRPPRMTTNEHKQSRDGTIGDLMDPADIASVSPAYLDIPTSLVKHIIGHITLWSTLMRGISHMFSRAPTQSGQPALGSANDLFKLMIISAVQSQIDFYVEALPDPDNGQMPDLLNLAAYAALTAKNPKALRDATFVIPCGVVSMSDVNIKAAVIKAVSMHDDDAW
jgi:hypothetical protein